ncbi:MAG: ATP-binding protein, partial [Candidatus Ornithospirochaeta sp.]
MANVFHNRKEELYRLAKSYGADRFEMIVIWGRRRIGKTQLLIESLKGRNSITCTGLKTSPENNLKSLSEAFFSVLMPGLPCPSFSSYKDLFDYLNHLPSFLEGEYIIALDEYPYLSGPEDELSSVLQYSIDHYWSKTKLKLVLCGSSVSFMKDRVLSGDSPFYGRTTLSLEIKKFMLWEMKAYDWNYS